jgi:hypothetical protein
LMEHIVAIFRTDGAAAAAERDLEAAGISTSRRYTPAETEKLEPESSLPVRRKQPIQAVAAFGPGCGVKTSIPLPLDLPIRPMETCTTGGLVRGTPSSA